MQLSDLLRYALLEATWFSQGSMTQPYPTACSIQKKIARTLDICYAKLMVSQIHTKRNLLTKCYESLVVSRFDESDVPLRDEERYGEVVGRKKRFYKGWNGISRKALQYVYDSDDFNFWMVNVCWIFTKQKMDCLLRFDLYTFCNQRYKRLLLHSVIHYLSKAR